MMKRDCSYTRKHLPRYLTGHLFGPQRQRIERHLRTCPICSSEYDALRRIDETRSILRDIDPPAGAGAALRRKAAGLTRLLYRPLWLAAIAAAAFALTVYVVMPLLHDPDLDRLDAPAPPTAPAHAPAVARAPGLPARTAEPEPLVDPLVVTITVDKDRERASLRQINDAMTEHALLRTMQFSDTVREISGRLTSHELLTFFNRIQGAGKISYKRSRLAKAEAGELLPFVMRLQAVAAPPASAAPPADKAVTAPAERPGSAAPDRPADRPADRSAPTASPAP
jgi:hypothetical protein